MNKEIFGLIHDYYPRERVISIQNREGLSFYYFSKGLINLFSTAMSHENVFVVFETSTVTKVMKGIPANQIIVIHDLFYVSKKGRIDLFDSRDMRESIRELINQEGYKMFMDLELTMPSYSDRTPFIPEIIQIGIVITDPDDQIVNYYTNYVKPNKPISDRAKKFLSLGPECFNEAIEYQEFYNDYKELLDIYDPIVYVWGGNDVKSLADSFKIHDVEPLNPQYIDLLKLHHQYFELKNDLGLFNALKIYRGIDATQAHHALTDAQATKEVFDSFKAHVNGTNMVDVKSATDKLASEALAKAEIKKARRAQTADGATKNIAIPKEEKE